MNSLNSTLESPLHSPILYTHFTLYVKTHTSRRLRLRLPPIIMDEYFQFFLATTATLLLFNYILIKLNPDMVPISWPVVGMLPHLLINLHRFHDYLITILTQINSLTFQFKGPWLSTSMNILLTIDPENIHHIMSKNFANFPKGEKFAEMFDILGDGIFSADSDLWKYQRRVTHSFLTHPSFPNLLIETVRAKAEDGLLPILDTACRTGETVDLEDLFGRFTFDTICSLVTGRDMKCLSIEFPDVPFCKGLDDAEEVLFYRHVIPESVWKVQRWVGVGLEKKMKKAWESLDEFIYKCVDVKMKEPRSVNKKVSAVDLLSLYIEGKDKPKDFTLTDKFLRDMFLNMLVAGRDTTSSALTWFFWLLHNNPEVESKIKDEIQSVITSNRQDTTTTNPTIRSQDMSKLVYLHGALCETLRLYPPVPLQHKSPIKPEVLPSGHPVSPTTKIIFSLYAMGRMKSIWGEDCLEFKPERWITERGNNKHEPSYKFLSFNAGPRTCLGKEMAFTQMKAVVFSVIVRGYRLEVVNGGEVEPDLSIILRTKRGLKVRVSR